MNKLLVEKIRKVYTNRLLEALKEVDVLDKEGNVLISKDLKVFHKDSGYEYTVSDVVNTPDGLKIVLRSPEAPRFEPAESTDLLDEADHESDRMEEEGEMLDDAHGDVFIVDAESFEKEYDVK